jgi:HAMP domain-containing protein
MPEPATKRNSQPARTTPTGSYLMDPSFQLKYTGALVAVAVVLMAVLGVAVERITHSAAEAGNRAVAQAERALGESQTSSRIVRMSEMERAAGDPERIGTIERELSAIDQQAQQNAERVRGEREHIGRTQRLTLFALLGVVLLMVLALAVAGILITRRVVAPMLRMKRLLRKVSAGRLDIQERLKQGDELAELFGVFTEMVEALKNAQSSEIEKLSEAIQAAQSEGMSASLLGKLRELRSDMQVALEPPEATLTTMKIAEIRELLQTTGKPVKK